jgi:hypothetical protein
VRRRPLLSKTGDEMGGGLLRGSGRVAQLPVNCTTPREVGVAEGTWLREVIVESKDKSG